MEIQVDATLKRIKNIFGMKVLKTTGDGRISKLQFLYLNNKEFRMSAVVKLAFIKKHFTEISKLSDFEDLVISDLNLIEYCATYYEPKDGETIFFNTRFTERLLNQ